MKAFYCSSIAALVLLSGCAGKSAKPGSQSVPPGVLALTPPAKGDPAQRLTTLLASEWQRWLVDHPEEASLTGDHRYDDRWTDMSLDAIEARHVADAAALLKLLEIDRERLTPAGQLNFDLYRQQLERDIEAYRYRGHLQPINHLGGVQTSDQLAEALQFETVLDYENWIRRIRGIDAAVDQSIVLLRMGLAEGRTVPKVIMKRVPPQIDRQLVKKPEASPLYTPFLKFAPGVPEDQRARLADAAKAAIRDSALPAWQRLKDVVAKEYLPKCRDSVGASELPEGRDAYAFAARTSTTTNLTPDEIHDIGQREVTRIRGEMEAIRKQVGYQGNLKAFFTYLRTDPKFFYRDGATLLSAYRDIAKRIDPELPKLFGKLPRLPYGVRAVPEASAPDTHTAYYQPGAADGTRAGNFYANLYKPGSRPKWEQEALTAHEAVPGHHLQIALQQELVSDAGGTLPAFRSQISFTAFVEGWGLYAESLGPEIGLYQDPYSKFGQLTYEMWRAVRLVVDTGMHAKGWSRQQAIDFFKANTPRAELDITNEIDRYIAWPGQALAYKIGELKIKELRARATATLGSKFDIRGFHDVVLGSGALPLDILERNVDTWIEQQDGGVIVKLRGTP
ncbi:DUF885 domain-containing protein [Nevskia ramosa]|uniref:DUF885 domain-containing protein n=1 Tax=Nevskia ramosa TaxID=64002 RepID=UPI0003B79D54|nr:DUF885 domain-containing protein [Nevskia ramosa]